MGHDVEAARILDDLALLGERAIEARHMARVALDERAEAFVAAIRAGARLEEIGDAAAMTKAAISVIALRRLDPRHGKGGPYRRRRGVRAALERVTESAGEARRARAKAHESVLQRDRAVLAAIEKGLPAPTLAQAIGMPAPALRALLARRRAEATRKPPGTLAS